LEISEIYRFEIPKLGKDGCFVFAILHRAGLQTCQSVFVERRRVIVEGGESPMAAVVGLNLDSSTAVRKQSWNTKVGTC
jgi:hypothetical protein